MYVNEYECYHFGKEPGHALKPKPDTIEVECDLTKKVLKIIAIGLVACAIAVAAIGILVIASLTAPGY